MDGHITAFIEYLEFEKGLSLNTGLLIAGI
jgi:hypothetical protein